MPPNRLLKIFSRVFSTSLSTNQLIKPPLSVFGINGRYATALYSAASKQQSLEAVEKDLQKVQDAISKDVHFQDFIKNPSIQRVKKSEVMKELASKFGLNPTTSNFLQLLAENGRLKSLNAVIRNFSMIMVAHRGEVAAEVITAIELDAAQKQKVEEVLKTFLKPNESLRLSLKIDPTIVGGMMVTIGDKFVDMSVTSKIKKYTELLQMPVVDL